jgi:hypothetical protein
MIGLVRRLIEIGLKAKSKYNNARHNPVAASDDAASTLADRRGHRARHSRDYRSPRPAD